MLGTLAKRFKGLLLKKDSVYASYKQQNKLFFLKI